MQRNANLVPTSRSNNTDTSLVLSLRSKTTNMQSLSNMYIYGKGYLYVDECVCICMYICICMCMYICIWICIRIRICICIYNWSRVFCYTCRATRFTLSFWEENNILHPVVCFVMDDRWRHCYGDVMKIQYSVSQLVLKNLQHVSVSANCHPQ